MGLAILLNMTKLTNNLDLLRRKGRAYGLEAMKRIADNWMSVIRIIGFTSFESPGAGRR